MSTDSEQLVADLEALLRIDENALEEALQQQPDAFWRVSKVLALESSRRDALKQYVKEEEAHAYLRIRRQAVEDETKLTEKELEAKVRVDNKVLDATDKLLRKAKLVAQLEALLESFKQRSYALKDLVELYLQSYYADSPSEGRRDLRDKQHMAVRKRQSHMRDRDSRRWH